MYGLDKQRWKQAIQEHIDSINKNRSWKLTIYNHQKSYSRLEVIIHNKKWSYCSTRPFAPIGRPSSRELSHHALLVIRLV